VTNPILRFSGDHRFLSNFFPSVVVHDGIRYPTVEHAFQAAKVLKPSRAATVILRWPFSHPSKFTAAQAKRAGRRLSLREDWESVKLTVMEECLRAKFSDVDLRTKLLDTGDAELVEGNNWNDAFWGYDDVRERGENHLGKLLMKIRAELR